VRAPQDEVLQALMVRSVAKPRVSNHSPSDTRPSHYDRGSSGICREVISLVIPGSCVSTRPQMCNCTSGNLEIPGSMLRIAPE